MNHCLLAVILLMHANAQAGPAIVAHRGASAKKPENTMASFKLAWEKGADAVECDVWLTKDNYAVCIHDRDTRRTTGKSLDVTKATLAQLKKLDAGNGEKIPTLKEVFTAAPKDKAVVVEVKGGWKIIPLISSLLEETGRKEEQTVIISFDENVIRESKKTLKNSKALLLVGYSYNRVLRRWEPSASKTIIAMKACWADGISVKASKPVTSELIRRTREAGGELHVWTVNEPDKARHYARLGVKSITTDNVDILKGDD